MPMNWFLENCIPAVDQERLDAVVKNLKTMATHGLTEHGLIKDFSLNNEVNSPSQMRTTEKAAFQRLSRFIQRILQSEPEKMKDCKYTMFRHTTLERTPTGNIPNTARADAYGHFGELDWANIFLAEEFKLSKEADAVKRVSD